MRNHSEWAYGSSFVKVPVFALMLVIAAIPAIAQMPTGVILGTVKDASGAVVPGATVTVLNEDTGVSRTQTTDENGSYRFSATPVGHYDVKSEHSAFKTVTQKGLVLDVSQEAVMNFILEVGTAAQQVTITGEAPVVTTTTASLGGLVNEEKMAELPLNGRNYADLTLLQPGVTSTTAGALHRLGGGSNGTMYSSNGAPLISNNILLDGTPEQTVLGYNAGNASGATLGVDGIREYRVVTSAFGAEYGMTMGSQMLIVSKGGSNSWHGDVFDYLRNRALDARNFFLTTANTPSKPQYQRNNFGGAFGGPIKKDKTFIWTVFEGLKEHRGVATSVQVFAPDCYGAAAGQAIWNGLGSQPSGSWAPSGKGCTDLGPNPSGASTNTVNMASAMVPILALYPQPNDLSNNNFHYSFIQPASDYFGQIRVDQNISNSDTFFARYTISNSAETVPYNQPTTEDLWAGRFQYLTLSEAHVFSPSLLNTVRLSGARTNLQTFPIIDPRMFGPTVSFNAASANQPIGIINFGGGANGSTFYTSFGPDLAAHNFHLQYYYTLGDDLFYSKGKHALKAGVQINRIQQIIRETVLSRGQMNFLSAANFFMGNPFLEVAELKGGIDGRTFNFYTYGFYAQDDWHVKPRLTLNLGLRYEFNTTINEQHGIQNAIPDLATNATAGLTPNLPMMRNPSKRAFSPRVGFGYDLTGNGKTAIRGFYGIYYDIADMGNVTFPEVVTDPLYRIIVANVAFGPQGGGLTFQPGWIGQPPFTNPPALGPFVSPNIPDYNQRQPYLQQWNLSVERQLPAGIGLTVSYVGTRGMHLWGQREGNPCGPTGYDDSAKTIPNWVNSANAQCPSTNLTYPSGHLCPFFPGGPPALPDGRFNCNFGYMTLIDTNERSWYDGLQMTVQKRLGHGLEFQSSYTYSKNLDTTQGAIFVAGEIRSNFTTLNIDKGRSQVDSTHNWRFNTLYHLPNIKSNNFAAGLLKGWWMGNIISVQSGYAFTPKLLNNQSLSGVVNGLPDRPNLASNFDSSKVITHDINQWFDPTMFSVQPAGHLGNATRGMLTGPGLFNWDFSIVKDTKISALGEAGNLQFRAEFFNIFNHPNFDLPNPVVADGGACPAGCPITSANAFSGSGAITSTGDHQARDIQFALKLIF
jgi:outer membrane receptor protein involved in Fe transport